MTSHLDGNILAGPLAQFLVPDATMIEGRCGGCGRIAPLGEAVVYPDAPGLVVRCKTCSHVLATIIDAGERLFLSFAPVSVRSISLARSLKKLRVGFTSIRLGESGSCDFEHLCLREQPERSVHS